AWTPEKRQVPAARYMLDAEPDVTETPGFPLYLNGGGMPIRAAWCGRPISAAAGSGPPHRAHLRQECPGVRKSEREVNESSGRAVAGLRPDGGSPGRGRRDRWSEPGGRRARARSARNP